MIKKMFLGLAACLWMLMAANAQAQCPWPGGDAQSGDFCYTVSDNTVTIMGYVGTNPDLVIPRAIEGMPVTNIGEEAFYDYSWLTSVTIPDSVTTIGWAAFWGCSGLTTMTIPASVTSIGSPVFLDCSGLIDIYVGEGNDFYRSNDGVLYNKNETVLIRYPAGRSGGFTIPDSVRRIEGDAFSSCSCLSSVTIPDSVTSIGGDAFKKCNTLPNVTIPASVTSIEGGAFSECDSLTSVTIPRSVTYIGWGAFSFCQSLSIANFLGNAPSMGGEVFARAVDSTAPDFNICYRAEATGFTTPTWDPSEWDSYPAAPCDCSDDTDCAEGHTCADGLCQVIPQPSFGNWTWLGGMEAPNWSEGNYGTKGVPDAVNVPMARWNSTSWTDSAGNLWLFGGVDQEFWMLDDLWRYDPASNMWTWMGGSKLSEQAATYGTKGVPAVANGPGARECSNSWADSSGNLWLFGGHNPMRYSYSLNDLWRYNISTHEWAWMSGADTDGQAPVYGTQGIPSAANVPGARGVSISWTDSSGNLWLFGGYGYHKDNDVDYYGYLNDLWRYDTATGMWTWMSGADTFNQSGVYGIKGEPDNANLPGCRRGSISWKDSADNLWLFGGAGIDSLGNEGDLNDLWRYNPSTNQWTWMSGSNLMDQIGTYGTRGTPDDANIPGARTQSISWVDDSGKLWLFGGQIKDSEGNWGYYLNDLNDLWRYDTVTGQWTWVSGSNVPNQVGIYAGKGTPCATSVPGSRNTSISWTDTSGNLWLFGGRGYWNQGGETFLNDLWRYELPECIMDNDCQEGESCVDGVCEQQIPDNPPALGDGPFLAAGTWPLLSASQESPMYLDAE